MKGYFHRNAVLVVLALCVLLPASAAWAEMKHVEIGRKEAPAAVPAAKDAPPPEGEEAAAPAPMYRRVIVTPVGDCFDKIGPKEAAALRREAKDPWHECQRRLKSREEKQGSEKDGGGKDKAGPDPAAKPASKEIVPGQSPASEK